MRKLILAFDGLYRVLTKNDLLSWKINSYTDPFKLGRGKSMSS